MLGVSRGGNTAVDIAAARLLFAWKAEIAMAVVVVRPNGDAAGVGGRDVGVEELLPEVPHFSVRSHVN